MAEILCTAASNECCNRISCSFRRTTSVRMRTRPHSVMHSDPLSGIIEERLPLSTKCNAFNHIVYCCLLCYSAAANSSTLFARGRHAQLRCLPGNRSQVAADGCRRRPRSVRRFLTSHAYKTTLVVTSPTCCVRYAVGPSAAWRYSRHVCSVTARKIGTARYSPDRVYNFCVWRILSVIGKHF